MPQDWAPWKAFATGMIAEYGFAATLVQSRPSAQGRVKGFGGVPGGATETRTSVTLVEDTSETSLDTRTGPADQNREGAVRAVTMRTFYMGVESGAVPEKKDVLELTAGETLVIDVVEPSAPGGEAVVYKIGVMA